MKINFNGKTNKNYCMINTAIFTMPDGTTFTVDRDRTYYDVEYGTFLSMEWCGCYLWEVNGNCLFDKECAYLGEDAAYYLNGAVDVELVLEDDADEDYVIKDIEFECY